MIYVVTMNNIEYEVEVEVGKASIVRTTTMAPSQTKTLVPEAAPVQSVVISAPTDSSGTVPEGAIPVKSPMPGTILDVKVQTGTTVRKGDVLLLLEAMKMENEITAAHDGTVCSIAVQKGATVSTGDLLLVIK